MGIAEVWRSSHSCAHRIGGKRGARDCGWRSAHWGVSFSCRYTPLLAGMNLEMIAAHRRRHALATRKREAHHPGFWSRLHRLHPPPRSRHARPTRPSCSTHAGYTATKKTDEMALMPAEIQLKKQALKKSSEKVLTPLADGCTLNKSVLLRGM